MAVSVLLLGKIASPLLFHLFVASSSLPCRACFPEPAHHLASGIDHCVRAPLERPCLSRLRCYWSSCVATRRIGAQIRQRAQVCRRVLKGWAAPLAKSKDSCLSRSAPSRLGDLFRGIISFGTTRRPRSIPGRADGISYAISRLYAASGEWQNRDARTEFA